MYCAQRKDIRNVFGKKKRYRLHIPIPTTPELDNFCYITSGDIVVPPKYTAGRKGKGNRIPSRGEKDLGARHFNLPTSKRGKRISPGSTIRTPFSTLRTNRLKDIEKNHTDKSGMFTEQGMSDVKDLFITQVRRKTEDSI